MPSGNVQVDTSVTSLAWSPDGKSLAVTSSNENRLRILDAATCQELLVIDLPTGITGNKLDMGLTVRWTPDGKHLLTLTGDRYLVGSQDYNLIVWDAASGRKISSIKIPNQAEPESGDLATSLTHYPTGAAIDIAPGSNRLATLGGNDTAIIWDDTYQTPQLTLVGHTNDVNSVAWSPDGRQLATASLDGTARTWDGKSGKTLFVLQGHTGRVDQALWSPDGRYLATAGEDDRHGSGIHPAASCCVPSKPTLGSSGAWPGRRIASDWSPVMMMPACAFGTLPAGSCLIRYVVIQG